MQFCVALNKHSDITESWTQEWQVQRLYSAVSFFFFFFQVRCPICLCICYRRFKAFCYPSNECAAVASRRTCQGVRQRQRLGGRCKQTAHRRHADLIVCKWLKFFSLRSVVVDKVLTKIPCVLDVGVLLIQCFYCLINVFTRISYSCNFYAINWLCRKQTFHVSPFNVWSGKRLEITWSPTKNKNAACALIKNSQMQ